VSYGDEGAAPGRGHIAASGVYFARLVAGDVTFNQKLMLVK